MPQDAEPLTILAVRSGGLAGIRRAWRVEAAGAAAEGWMPLVDACPWEEPPAADAGADRFVWELSVAGAGCARRASFGESAAAGPWHELIERVRADGETVPAA